MQLLFLKFKLKNKIVMKGMGKLLSKVIICLLYKSSVLYGND